MLSLTPRSVEKLRVLVVNGKIDARTMNDFEEGIRAEMDAGHKRLVLDMAAVPFISSAGLGILMSVIEEIREEQAGDLVLAAVVPEVYRIFDLLEFTTLFRFFDTVDAAVLAFDAEA